MSGSCRNPRNEPIAQHNKIMDEQDSKLHKALRSALIPRTKSTIKLQPEVAASVGRMYERYAQIAALKNAVAMSVDDFINLLIIRGMVEYNAKLIEIEKELGLIE